MTTTEAPAATAAPATPAWAEGRVLSTLALIAGIVAVVFGQTFFVPVAALVLGAVMLFGWALLAIFGTLFVLPFIPFALL